MANTFQVSYAQGQIKEGLKTLVECALQATTLPTAYISRTKGTIEISKMNPFHLVNAARKVGAGPMYTALCAEIGRRFVRGETV